MGYDYDELFPGRFVKAADLKGRDVTLTISAVTIEELPQDGAAPRMRGIIAFAGAKKTLVLNRTNGECLKAMFGRDTGEWIGKRVTLFPAQIESFGGQDVAIRVRGSPDIAKDMAVELKLPRRRAFTVTMRRTGAAVATSTAPAAKPPSNGKAPAKVKRPEPEPESDFDPLTGEVKEAAPPHEDPNAPF